MRGYEPVRLQHCVVGDVFDPDGNVKDTIYLSSSQTKGSDSCTVLVNSKLQKQLVSTLRSIPNMLQSLTLNLSSVPSGVASVRKQS